MGQSSAWKLKIIRSSWEEKYLNIRNEVDAHGKVRACWIILEFEQRKWKIKVFYGEKEWGTIIASW